MKKLIVLTTILFTLFAHAAALFCKEDGTLLTWTGNSKFESKTLWEYKCMGGHIFWLEPIN